MKKLFLAASLMLLLTPVLGLAQNAFDGTWKIDMNKAEFPKKPDVYLLQNGMYECKTCVPAVKIKADGQDQKVTGHPYYDTAAVKVISDHEIEETDKKDGKTVATSTTTVSADGNTLAFEFNDSSNTNAAPVTGKGEETRVTKGPAGSNAISGSWRISKFENLSDNAITWTYKVSGNELMMSTPTGQSYTAKLDGTEAPYQGDPGTTAVSVKMSGKNALQETDKRGDKVLSVSTMTMGADGKTATIMVKDILHGTTSQFVAVKQ
jgi:hypothetical protein